MTKQVLFYEHYHYLLIYVVQILDCQMQPDKYLRAHRTPFLQRVWLRRALQRIQTQLTTNIDEQYHFILVCFFYIQPERTGKQFYFTVIS